MFLTSEQMNATRQSILRGDWMQGLRIASMPLRVSLYRLRKNRRKPVARVAVPSPAPSPEPLFSAAIYPLFACPRLDLSASIDVGRLFYDVDQQIEGTFRLAGGTYRRISFENIDRLSEVEDQHAIERLYWLERYARAAAFGHAVAADALQSSWAKWLTAPRSPAAFQAYTAAERICSLSATLLWMRESPVAASAEQIISIKRQAWKDAHFLSSNIESALGIHNHLLNDARGLFRASRMLADLPEAREWQEQAFSLWDSIFPQLILDDGVFAEQSSHYQLLLCRTALEYFLAGRCLNRQLPGGLEAQLSKMFQVANDFLRPDGSLPRFGDNSPDHTAEDLWGLMAAAHEAGLVKSPPRHTLITPLTLFYCGQMNALETAERPRSESALYPQGGFMFLRSKDRAAELTIHGDPRPELRAHGDCGRGSFELWWRGHVIVREPGSFLSASNPLSTWSRGGHAQNVTCLNDLPPMVTSDDGKFLPPSYTSGAGQWETNKIGVVRFRWDGFSRLQPDIVLSRSWHFAETGELCMEERIEGSAVMHFQSRLCLGDGQWKLTPRDCGCALDWAGPDDLSLRADFAFPAGLTAKLQEGLYLPEFGVAKRATVFVLAGKIHLSVSWSVRWEFAAAPTQQPSNSQQPTDLRQPKEMLSQCAE